MSAESIRIVSASFHLRDYRVHVQWGHMSDKIFVASHSADIHSESMTGLFKTPGVKEALLHLIQGEWK